LIGGRCYSGQLKLFAQTASEVRELFNTYVDQEWENVMKVLSYQIRRGDKEVMKWIIEQRIGRGSTGG